MPRVLRLAAFTDDPRGGNPAGVVPDAEGLSADEMQAIAAEVGYSETAFLVGGGAIRYFSPVGEVPFCGHATIATGVVLGDGDHLLRTLSGDVRVQVRDGVATLTSVEPHVEELPEAELEATLAGLGWSRDDLDPALPPRVAFAGARHIVLGVRTRERLAALDYDFEALAGVSERLDLITIALLWREDATTFHARDPFPRGGVVEDPATGAAAAAFGGYLRELGLVTPPAELVIRQGEDMGRPSRLEVHVPVRGGIAVSGRAVALTAA